MEHETWTGEADILLEDVARRANLAEGGEGVRDVLLQLYRSPKLKNKTLSLKTQIAIPALAACRGELVTLGLLTVDKKQFTPDGHEWVEKHLGFRSTKESTEGHSYTVHNIPFGFEALHKKLEKVLAGRPEPRFDLDQSRADSTTVTKRVVYMLQNGDIEGRNVIFLGDDDGTALGAGMLGTKVTVLEIDRRIIEYLEKSAVSLGLQDFSVVEHDLAQPVPTRFQGKFDVFFTDPPYSLPGLKLFMLRGKSCLKKLTGKRAYVCFGSKPPLNAWKSQLILLNTGFRLREVIPGFSRYKGASIIGQYSNMYYLKQTHLVPLVEKPFTGPYYTAEVSEAKLFDTPNRRLAKNSADKYLGYHIVAEFYGIPSIRERGTIFFEDLLVSSCQQADLSVVEVNTHQFYPHGISVVVILEESHVSLHTWPENDYCSVDIFVCSGADKAELLLVLLEEKLQPKTVEKNEFYRGGRKYGNKAS
ncbi:MAG: adenosylmethionine decarboxylase [Candidatus Odinarchaeota archaeon]